VLAILGKGTSQPTRRLRPQTSFRSAKVNRSGLRTTHGADSVISQPARCRRPRRGRDGTSGPAKRARALNTMATGSDESSRLECTKVRFDPLGSPGKRLGRLRPGLTLSPEPVEGPALAAVPRIGRGFTRRREGAKRGLGASASCWQFSAKARASQQGASAPRPRFAPQR
jgi:hypothetical protein